ncbi:hypothetical protein [Nitratireductor sp. ZSWI3]|uniref:hypothetical protein n=1 Tax=Nitratireductor sp. ZSWI3 TaxID=2966359 RepID=UPI00214F93E4|nr:hypothetical protein [Nitratireductor sp. ZSWI3]MCR4266549.1 hypothetical protein [Nitratireductor sp. ZSWI3]
MTQRVIGVFRAICGVVASYMAATVILAPFGFLASWFSSSGYVTGEVQVWAGTILPIHLGALLFYLATVRWAERKAWWGASDGAIAIAIVVPIPALLLSVFLAAFASSDQPYRLIFLLALFWAAGWIVAFLLLLWRAWRKSLNAHPS